VKQRGWAELRVAAHDRAGASVFQAGPVIERARFEVYSFPLFAVRRNDIYPDEDFQLAVD
jgi:hypothetical protein